MGLLGGRFPILIILVLGLVVAATKGVPWALKQFRDPTPVFRVDDVRDARYLPPYAPILGSGPGARREDITVYGPSVTARYVKTRESSFIGQSLKPEAVIVGDARETFVLPDGERLSLAALVLIPNAELPRAPVKIPLEEVYHHPDGQRMTRQEAEALRDRFGMPANALDWRPWGTSQSYVLRAEFETDLEREAFARVMFHDSLTGASTSGHSMYHVGRSYGDGPQLIGSSTPYDAVRPTPLGIHAMIWQGERTVAEFDPVAPRTISLEGGERKLVAVRTLGRQEMEETTVSGDPDVINPMSTGGPYTGFLFDDQLPLLVSTRAVLRDGSRVKPWTWSSSAILFREGLDDIETIEFVEQPRLAHVIIQLPELPIIPRENIGKTNVNEMVFPTTIVQNDYTYRELSNSVLQAQFQSNRAPGAVLAPTGPLPTFPLELTGRTVGEFLQMELDRYPPHEIVMTQTDTGGTSIELQSIGTTRAVHAPGIARTFAFFSNSWQLVLIVASLLALIKGWILMRAYDLHRLLRVRGYGDWSFWDAERAYIGLGKRAWNIPSMDELGSIPGVDATDVRSVVKFLGRVKGEE